MTHSARQAEAGAPPMPAPRFATAREPGRLSYGPAVGRVARLRRRPLMPWQQLVADVGGEVNERGMWVYPLVVVTVQRQAGKTDLDLCQSLQRALMGPNRRVWHTAQTGQDAREKWDEMVDEIWEDPTSPFREMVRGKPLRSNGKEALTFVNGSKLRPHPPTRDALHGKQSDTNNIDEAWSFDEVRGNELLQAITPTQTTRWRPPYNGAQTWVWSTAGDAQSEWFWKLVHRGRRGDPGMAYFEWSIPDGADPFDLEMIAAHHPAFGITVTMDSLQAAYTQLADKPGEFARAYGNVWTGAGERIISTADWERGRTVEDVPDGPAAFGVAVAHDGSAAAVVAAVADAAGRPWLEVLAHRPGRAWVVGFMRQFGTDATVGVLRRGPAAGVAQDLADAGFELPPLGDAEYTAACADLFDRLTDADARGPDGPRVRIRAHEGMDTAADVAGKRLVGDGGWVWSRSRSAGDVSPLEAGTVAAYLVRRPVAAEPAPDWAFA
jgi:hypothetical protein